MIIQTTQDVSRASLSQFMSEVRPVIERALVQNLPVAPPQIARTFGEAIHSALFSGGKRIRPALTILGAGLVGGSPLSVLGPATAVEYIHTSSLIFDDLPCMDNALERRGKRALHVQYGEGVAVLVALALLNRAYSLMIENEDTNPEHRILSHWELTRCIEAQIFGQTLDIAPAACCITPEDHAGSQSLRNLKASALVKLSVKLGAIFSGASEERLNVLSRFAELLGNAYQISDDINDEAEDNGITGGPRHTTLPAEYGAENAKQRVQLLAKEAKDILSAEFSSVPSAMILCEITDYVAARCG